jgi:hypothetical protein
MIGNFYPFIVQAAVLAPALSPVAVRSVSAATEIANDVQWFTNDD